MAEGDSVAIWGGGVPGSEKAFVQRVGADGKVMWGERGILLNKANRRG